MSATPPVGILLAAGRSTRMGRPKQLLPWPPPDGPDAMVAAAFDAIAWACADMVVVVASPDNEVVAALGDRRFHAVVPDGEAMLDSASAGLRAVGPGADAMLQLADHPEVARSSVQTLLDNRAGIAVMPEYAGHGGHPVLIPAALFADILDNAGPGGLRAYWREHPDCCRRLRVDDPGVVRDLDGPADYVSSSSGR